MSLLWPNSWVGGGEGRGDVGVCLCCEMQLSIQQCQSWHRFPTGTDEFNHIISRCDTAASDDELFILTRLATYLSEMPSVPALPSLGEKVYASYELFCISVIVPC